MAPKSDITNNARSCVSLCSYLTSLTLRVPHLEAYHEKTHGTMAFEDSVGRSVLANGKGCKSGDRYTSAANQIHTLSGILCISLDHLVPW